MSSSDETAATTTDSATDAPFDPTVERVRAALEGVAFEPVEPADGMACVEVDRDALHATLERLRDEAGFETITFVTAIDYLGERTIEPRFHVIHQLHSLAHADRVRVRTRIDSSDAVVPSCTDLWPGAGFMERECWDMFGIRFEGNPNLTRLLMPTGYGHHPLRKDFPHQGIEPDRLYREWDRERRTKWNASDAKQER